MLTDTGGHLSHPGSGCQAIDGAQLAPSGFGVWSPCVVMASFVLLLLFNFFSDFVVLKGSRFVARASLGLAILLLQRSDSSWNVIHGVVHL